MDADRDRGTPRGAAPGIRVRTTAVRPGKQSGPLQMRQSERGEVRDGKRPAERGSASGAPRPAVAASREDGVLRIHAAFPQLAETRAGSLPLLPDGGAEAPPNPRRQGVGEPSASGSSRSTPASPTVRRQLPHHLVQTARCGSKQVPSRSMAQATLSRRSWAARRRTTSRLLPERRVTGATPQRQRSAS